MVKMKGSGIEWIGEIPEHWDMVKGKYLFTNNKEIVGKGSDDFRRLALTLNGIIERDKESSDGLQPINFDTYQIVKENNLIFKLIDLQNISTSRVGLTWSDGIMSPAYIRLIPNKNLIIQFYEKFYLMMWYYNIFNNLGDAGVRSNLNATDLLNIKIPYPPIEEQHLIATQLNQVCGTLDDMKSDIEKQIEVLQEYKKSVITEAVTKGLDKNVEMKESGVDWIGEIPKHWSILPLKYLCFMKSGKNITTINIVSEKTSENRYPVYGANGLRGYYNCYTNYGNYCIVGRQGALAGNVHFVNGEFWATDHAVVCYSHQNTYSNYLYYLLVSMDLNQYAFDTAAQPGLSVEKILNLRSTIPPIKEQEEIVEYLDKKCSQIDTIIETKKKQLETLEEYKKSIIYEYVTGKRAVSAKPDSMTDTLAGDSYNE